VRSPNTPVTIRTGTSSKATIGDTGCSAVAGAINAAAVEVLASAVLPTGVEGLAAAAATVSAGMRVPAIVTAALLADIFGSGPGKGCCAAADAAAWAPVVGADTPWSPGALDVKGAAAASSTASGGPVSTEFCGGVDVGVVVDVVVVESSTVDGTVFDGGPWSDVSVFDEIAEPVEPLSDPLPDGVDEPSAAPEFPVCALLLLVFDDALDESPSDEDAGPLASSAWARPDPLANAAPRPRVTALVRSHRFA